MIEQKKKKIGFLIAAIILFIFGALYLICACSIPAIVDLYAYENNTNKYTGIVESIELGDMEDTDTMIEIELTDRSFVLEIHKATLIDDTIYSLQIGDELLFLVLEETDYYNFPKTAVYLECDGVVVVTMESYNAQAEAEQLENVKTGIMLCTGLSLLAICCLVKYIRQGKAGAKQSTAKDK